MCLIFVLTFFLCLPRVGFFFVFFFFNDTATTEIYTLSLHDALPIRPAPGRGARPRPRGHRPPARSEEHTSELQSPVHLVCRLLLEKKKQKQQINTMYSDKNYTLVRTPQKSRK